MRLFFSNTVLPCLLIFLYPNLHIFCSLEIKKKYNNSCKQSFDLKSNESINTVLPTLVIFRRVTGFFYKNFGIAYIYIYLYSEVILMKL